MWHRLEIQFFFKSRTRTQPDASRNLLCQPDCRPLSFSNARCPGVNTYPNVMAPSEPGMSPAGSVGPSKEPTGPEFWAWRRVRGPELCISFAARGKHQCRQFQTFRNWHRMKIILFASAMSPSPKLTSTSALDSETIIWPRPLPLLLPALPRFRLCAG